MDLLTGFVTIGVAIACGALLAHIHLVDLVIQRALADLSFFVATPALMLLTISRIDPTGALGATLLAAAGSLAVAFGVYATVAVLVLEVAPGAALIGSLSASYVNAGNLGLAVAAYVVGDIRIVVPTLLVQVLCVQPLALAALDRRAARRNGGGRSWLRSLTNPLTVCSALGLVLAVSGTTLPPLLESPLELLAGFAIPAMLLAYGASLRLNPGPGRSGHRREIGVAAGAKLLVHPSAAWGIGSVLGLSGAALLGVVLAAALPTAQNIFMHATRYRVGEVVARETILLTTMCSLPAALIVLLLLR